MKSLLYIARWPARTKNRQICNRHVCSPMATRSGAHPLSRLRKYSHPLASCLFKWHLGTTVRFGAVRQRDGTCQTFAIPSAHHRRIHRALQLAEITTRYLCARRVAGGTQNPQAITPGPFVSIPRVTLPRPTWAAPTATRRNLETESVPRRESTSSLRTTRHVFARVRGMRPLRC